MLFTITGMVAGRQSANLMSLGALDFGLIVDGAVIIVENCVRRLGEEQHRHGRLLTTSERFAVVFAASKEVRRATVFGEAIITIVYLPILTLTGVEGKMFFPMAFTVIVALLGAMILSLTFVPAAIALTLDRQGRGAREPRDPRCKARVRTGARPSALATGGRRLSRPSRWSLSARCSRAVWGREFIPSLDEGDIALHALRIPGHEPQRKPCPMQHVLEERLARFPEVETVFAKIGTGDVATDPMPPSVADGFVMMKPRASGPTRDKLKADLVARDGSCRRRGARQQLRIHAADRDALQRAHRRRAKRRRRQGVRRRHGRVARDGGAD